MILVTGTRLILLLLALIPSTCGLGTIILPGDVYIEFIAAIYKDPACTAVDVQSIQNMAAVKWTLETLQSVNTASNSRFKLNFKIGKLFFYTNLLYYIPANSLFRSHC